MSDDQTSRASFSAASRMKIALDVALRTVLVLAVVVMVNFLAAKLFHRFYLSSQTRLALSSRTLSVLHSLTNRVNVTLYYDRKDDFYPDIAALLNEYRAVNHKISIRTVDYVRDAGEAEKAKAQYRLNAAADKNLVIFECDQRIKTIPGDALTQFTLERIAPKNRTRKNWNSAASRWRLMANRPSRPCCWRCKIRSRSRRIFCKATGRDRSPTTEISVS